VKQIAYSRGKNKEDNAPRQMSVPDFGAFIDAIDRDRAPRKDIAAYICGPMNGSGRRCAEGALPRRWIPPDLDGIRPDKLPEVISWFSRFSACAWPTHSDKPEAPRRRVIIELDRDASREECIHIGAVLQDELGKAFPGVVKVDPSTFQNEQPNFLPPLAVTIARFDGKPLKVDEYLARKPPPKASGGAQSDAKTEDDWLRQIERGEALHDSLRALIGRMAAKGMSSTTAKAAALGLIERARRLRPERVDDLVGEELQRMVDGAIEKYSPKANGRPLDIFRDIAAPALDPSDFPPILADFAVPLARAAGHDPAAYLMAGLATAAVAVDDSIRLLLDSRTSWFESARLWVLLLGAPGTAKTPAIKAAMRPVYEHHKALRAKAAAERAQKKKEDGLDEDERTPVPATFINDATIEKMSEILADNPRGIIAVYEELDTWLGAHDAYRGGQGSKDRGEWLRLFDGGPNQVDRIKRGSMFVPNWGCSILGATTPAGLMRHAKQLPPDGLIQRFLPVLVRPMQAADETILGATISRAKQQAEFRISDLFNQPPGVVRLSREAAEVFFARRDALRTEVPAVAAMSEPFAGHLAKHAGLLGRVALTMHCLEHGTACGEDVSGETMRRADRLLRKLTRHALALFQMLAGNEGSIGLAQAVGRAIVAGKFEAVTRRELLHNCRAFRDATEQARESALRYLEDAAWLTPVHDGRQYGGRAAWFNVMPEVLERFAEQGEELKRRREMVREMFGA